MGKLLSTVIISFVLCYSFFIAFEIGVGVVYLVIGIYVQQRFHWSYDGNIFKCLAVAAIWPLWLLGFFFVGLYKGIRS